MIIAVLFGIATGEVVATVTIARQATKAEHAAQEEIRQAALSGSSYRQVVFEGELKASRKVRRSTRID